MLPHYSFEFIDLFISFNKLMRKKASGKGFTYDGWMDHWLEGTKAGKLRQFIACGWEAWTPEG